LHEISLYLLVAGGANSLVKLGVSIHMAGLAQEGRPIRLLLVGGESIPKNIMGNIDHGQVSQGTGRASVIRVAGPAGQPGFFRELVAMQTGWVQFLGCHIRMA
jgi:hypothetical protein